MSDLLTEARAIALKHAAPAEELFRMSERDNALSVALRRRACAAVIGEQVRIERKEIWSPTPKYIAARTRAGNRTIRVAEIAAETLLDFPLPTEGNKRLGDAVTEEVCAASEWLSGRANTMSHQSRWLALVAAATPKGKTVREAVTPESLATMKEAANNE